MFLLQVSKTCFCHLFLLCFYQMFLFAAVVFLSHVSVTYYQISFSWMFLSSAPIMFLSDISLGCFGLVRNTYVYRLFLSDVSVICFWHVPITFFCHLMLSSVTWLLLLFAFLTCSLLDLRQGSSLPKLTPTSYKHMLPRRLHLLLAVFTQ